VCAWLSFFLFSLFIVTMGNFLTKKDSDRATAQQVSSSPKTGGSSSTAPSRVKQRRALSATQPELTQRERAHLQLKRTRDHLERVLERHEVVQKEERARAVEFMKHQDQKRALECMKRVRRLDDQIRNHAVQLENVQKVIEDTQEQEFNMEFFKTMESANEALSVINREMSTERAEQIMDSVYEELEKAKEAGEILGAPLDAPLDAEGDLEELDRWIHQESRVKQSKSAAQSESSKVKSRKGPTSTAALSPEEQAMVDAATVPNEPLPTEQNNNASRTRTQKGTRDEAIAA
jgi:hypothetical protein